MTDACKDRLEQAVQAESVLKSMAHAQRLLLLSCMAEGELSSSTIAERAGINLPVVSHHLGILRNAGLIESRRRSREVLHRIVSPQARGVLEALRVPAA
jgi:DNA-binding transcriptional ArsR family regulator